ncbi:DNA-binding transcriptional regulator, ArsR family [Paenibacillus catalpae]|uniref:DNA-binding transcriptional regulator, ArsR family n=1 Tax=Paenibacillus catalpae TaxID=1045775 RepID=A0A1I1XN74_9BACL|nr:metalloregulator ArsR/SmtB family transcription factor [Paenibacillus catalpae]SFE08792.1 DNA-binding transcriptional regulator, ArsR family [Paenibacillus catalpae]
MDPTKEEIKIAANLLKAISHPVRLRIVKVLAEQNSCNVSFLQDCMGLPQSTVSTHLQKLRTFGVVGVKRKSTEVAYSLNNQQVKQIITLLFPKYVTHHDDM